MPLRKFLIAFAVCVSAVCSGATPRATTTLTLDDNIATPAVTAKAGAAVARHMEVISKKFSEKKLDTKTIRNNQVVLVTLPADRLFEAGSTALRPGAENTIAYFRQALLHPESYRVVVAVYADDTGDHEYTSALTGARAQAIKKAIGAVLSNEHVTPNVDYYWFGPERYVSPNNTIANRAKNRRIEIYIIPENHIIEASRAK